MALAISILLIAAVIVAVGLFAAGRIDGMSASAPDAPPGLPEGPVTPEALRAVKLPVVLRGYRMADVDEMIERAAAELDAGRGQRPSPAAPIESSASYESAPTTRKPRPTPSAAGPDVLEHDPIDG